jgi:hypothetical protein
MRGVPAEAMMELERLEERVRFLEQVVVTENVQAGEAIAATIALVAFVLDRAEGVGVARRKETMRQLEIWAENFEGTNLLASQMMRSLLTSLQRKGRTSSPGRA